MKKSFLLLLFCVLLFLVYSGDAQIITTVVGIGSPGIEVCGSEGPATARLLSYGSDAKFDKLGNIYFAEGCTSGSVQKVDTSGYMTIFAGNCMGADTGDGGLATAASIIRPSGVAFDNSGNLYISDMDAGVIRMVNTSGIISTIAGNRVIGFSGDGGPATNAELYDPTGIVCDSIGNLYISDALNLRIRKIDLSGIISTVVGDGHLGYSGDGGMATDAEIFEPEEVIFDKRGNLFFADGGENCVREVNSNGIISTIAGNSTGLSGYSGDGGQATDAELWSPVGIAIDDYDNLFISDCSNNVIREVYKSSGIIETIAGNGFGAATLTGGHSGDGGPPLSAELYAPTMMSFDKLGNLYFAEWYNNDVRKIIWYPTSVVEINQEKNIELYPNPSNDKLNIILVGIDGNVNFIIYNLVGQQILNQTVSFKEMMTLNISSFPEGTYILNIQSENSSSINKRFEIVR